MASGEEIRAQLEEALTALGVNHYYPSTPLCWCGQTPVKHHTGECLNARKALASLRSAVVLSEDETQKVREIVNGWRCWGCQDGFVCLRCEALSLLFRESK